MEISKFGEGMIPSSNHNRMQKKIKLNNFECKPNKNQIRFSTEWYPNQKRLNKRCALFPIKESSVKKIRI